ncbi:MAG TPA: substrate-binding domain-containing protein [Thermoplasmata archaeon]|nr:substrate-binding domain-containing protein [Thermoplasmata archaeon]
MRAGMKLVGVALVAGLATIGGFGAGYALAPRSASAGPAGAANTLSISAAGTLGTLFPEVAGALANETPGIHVPSSAQQYQGSLAAIQAVRNGANQYDLVASADYRLIPSLLEPTGASWEAAFATTPEVLAYDPSVSALSGLNTSNWPGKIVASGVTLGVANASTDPNGYNAIFVLELQGLLDAGDPNALYGHFFTTPPGQFALPDPTYTKVEPETQAATLLGQHQISTFLIYRSYAIQHHLSYVTLDPRVGLGGLNASDVAFDARVSTEILASTGGDVRVTGAPVVFAVSVPTSAPNASLGEAFIHLLLSPQGEALLTQGGFDAIFPGWTDRPSAVPGLLAPDLVPMPSGLPIG